MYPFFEQAYSSQMDYERQHTSFKRQREEASYPRHIQDEIIAVGNQRATRGLLQVVKEKGNAFDMVNALTCLNR